MHTVAYKFLAFFCLDHLRPLWYHWLTYFGAGKMVPGFASQMIRAVFELHVPWRGMAQGVLWHICTTSGVKSCQRKARNHSEPRKDWRKQNRWRWRFKERRENSSYVVPVSGHFLSTCLLDVSSPRPVKWTNIEGNLICYDAAMSVSLNHAALVANSLPWRHFQAARCYDPRAVAGAGLVLSRPGGVTAVPSPSQPRSFPPSKPEKVNKSPRCAEIARRVIPISIGAMLFAPSSVANTPLRHGVCRPCPKKFWYPSWVLPGNPSSSPSVAPVTPALCVTRPNPSWPTPVMMPWNAISVPPRSMRNAFVAWRRVA